MKNLLMTVALCVATGWLVPSAHGQLSSYVDEHGNLVYTNADSPARRKAAAEKKSVALGCQGESRTGPRQTGAG